MKFFISFKTLYSNIIQWWMNVGLFKKIMYPATPVLLIIIIWISISPLYKLKEFTDLVSTDSIYLSGYDSIFNHQEIIPLIRERNYKEALIRLSENDSINLIVNLHDSLIGLSIHGVIIHAVKIRTMEIDPMLARLPNHIYTKLFSEPLDILNEDATIVKEPIVERQAPKDTLEAMLNAYTPDTLIQNPGFLHMRLEHGIGLVFEQDSNPTFYDQWVQILFRIRMSLKALSVSTKEFFLLRKHDYKPVVLLKMPVDDLRSIFRALPARAKVVIYYD